MASSAWHLAAALALHLTTVFQCVYAIFLCDVCVCECECVCVCVRVFVCVLIAEILSQELYGIFLVSQISRRWCVGALGMGGVV